MKPIVCIYCEGTDVKLAVLVREKGNIKILRVASLTVSRTHTPTSKSELVEELNAGGLPSDDLSFDNIDTSESDSLQTDTSDVATLHSVLRDLKISKMNYIPVVTEPIVNYHPYDGPRDNSKKKLIQALIKDLQVSKGITVEEDSVDVTELNDKAMLGVFIEGEIPCVSLINQLANFNRKRYLKIPTIKSAELALAHYVSKSTKFFQEDYTLIVYIGKEYSKLLFLEGKKLKHVGSTLDI